DFDKFAVEDPARVNVEHCPGRLTVRVGRQVPPRGRPHVASRLLSLAVDHEPKPARCGGRLQGTLLSIVVAGAAEALEAIALPELHSVEVVMIGAEELTNANGGTAGDAQRAIVA